ncbi:MAG: hypothetical protein HC901_04545 [Bdellovibrionaceae bacterium]|nr:hypothetical protein [Pseudobdellovibrionaceae bacterium]
MRALAKPLCWLAMLLVSGAHWFILQSIAWAGMLLLYSANDGLPAGVAKTFDGQHPCALCEKVDEGRRSEEAPKLPLLKLDKKADWFAQLRPLSLAVRTPLPAPDHFPASLLTEASRFDVPETPPPRV